METLKPTTSPGEGGEPTGRTQMTAEKIGSMTTRKKTTQTAGSDSTLAQLWRFPILTAKNTSN